MSGYEANTLNLYQNQLIELSQLLSYHSSDTLPVKKTTIRKYDCVHRIRVMELINNLLTNINFNDLSSVDYKNTHSYSIIRDLVLIWINTRSIRTKYGWGVRLSSYWIFNELYTKYPYTMYWFLYEMPKFGSFVDLNNLYELMHLEGKTNLTSYQLKDDIAKVYAYFLMKDIQFVKNNEGKNLLNKEMISYAAKWVPREGRSLSKKTGITSHIVKYLYPNLYKYNKRRAMVQFRKDISLLNKTLDTTEIHMAGRNFSKINFETVPKKCFDKHEHAWKGTDQNGYFKYANDNDRIKCRANYTDFINNKQIGFHQYDYNFSIDQWKNLRIMLDSEDYNSVREILGVVIPCLGTKKINLSRYDLSKLPEIFCIEIAKSFDRESNSDTQKRSLDDSPQQLPVVVATPLIKSKAKNVKEDEKLIDLGEDVDGWVNNWIEKEKPTKFVKRLESIERFILGYIQYGTLDERIKNLEINSFGYSYKDFTFEESLRNLEIQLL